MIMRSKNVFFVLVLLLGWATGANVVVQWNTVALKAIRSSTIAPPVAAHVLAMMHRAILDALAKLQCKNRASSCTPLATSIAVSAAAHQVLGEVFIAQLALFDETLANVTDSFSRAEPNSAVDTMALGIHSALKVIRLHSDDNSLSFTPYKSQKAQGRWVSTPPSFNPRPLLPHWGNVKPFLINSIAGMLPAGVPAFDSNEYREAWHEVLQFGAAVSPVRTEAQTQIATFWAAGQGTATPPGMWNVIATDILSHNRQPTDLYGYAEVFMLLNVAQANAGIAAWAAKYKYDTWRPVTAMRSGLTQVPALPSNPTWTPLLPTPPFPEYVSGHSTFSSASARISGIIFGTNNITFTAQSDAPSSTPRVFKTLSSAAEEAGQSRIYGGIHFQFANRAGRQLGKFIADAVYLEWGITSNHDL